MPDIACLNGQFQPLEDARVSVNDRGYLFGDGVYEVIRTYHGQPFLLNDHLARLDTSLAQVRIQPDWTRQELTSRILNTIARAGYANTKVYVQVTRGVAPRNHPFPEAAPTTLITATEIHPVAAEMVRAGVSAIAIADIRWGRCDIKSLNLLPNVLARQAAQDAGAFEAILFDADSGHVREGSSSNVCCVIDGTIVTPPLGHKLLAGVSRGYMLGLAGRAGIPVQQRQVTLDELKSADEVFLTGTTIEVLGVRQIDGQPVGDGTVGPVTRTLAAAFGPATHAEAG